jgi:hypothetical protein
MRGRAVGQIRDSHVHKRSGQYVGELHDDLVVDEHLGNLGNIGNPGSPGSPGTGAPVALRTGKCISNSVSTPAT